MKVRIKSWDKMAEKYGVDSYGDISKKGHPYCFTKQMEFICGKEVELESVNSSYESVLGKYDGFYIEKWMVKKNGK